MSLPPRLARYDSLIDSLIDVLVDALAQEIEAESVTIANEKPAASGKTKPRVGDFKREENTTIQQPG